MNRTLPHRLLAGYDAFCRRRLPEEQARFRALAEEGQKPRIMLVGCCDSRVSPEVIFDARPGELFVVRNVANLVPPCRPDGMLHGVSAALEFAVAGLEVQHVVVLGHGQCGGIRAFAAGEAPLTEGDFIGTWMRLLGPVAEGAGPRGDRDLEEWLSVLELQSVRASLDNLMSFPFVADRVAKGQLALHGAWFNVATGDLSALDPAADAFVPVRPG